MQPELLLVGVLEPDLCTSQSHGDGGRCSSPDPLSDVACRGQLILVPVLTTACKAAVPASGLLASAHCPGCSCAAHLWVALPLLQNLHATLEMAIRTWRGTPDWHVCMV